MPRRRRNDRQLRLLRERKYKLQGTGKTHRFIPDADSDFARMAKHFAAHVASDAERFAIPAEQVDALENTVAAFREALYRTKVHSSAGPRATLVKNEARATAEKQVRDVAKLIRGTSESALTSVDRLHLNLPEKVKRAKARLCPQVSPLLRFVGATHEAGRAGTGVPRHILEYGNDFDRSSNAKPHGAARLELFVELVPIGTPTPTQPGQLSGGRLWYLRSFSTSRFEVEFPVLDDGSPALVVYWGRWADARGGVGPFSQTCVARMEGGPESRGLLEPMYLGKRAALPGGASVKRLVEPKQFAMLEAQESVRIVQPRQLESDLQRCDVETAEVIEQKRLDVA